MALLVVSGPGSRLYSSSDAGGSDGFTPVSGYSLSGTFADGETVTLTGSGFGAPAQAPPRIFHAIDFTLINGVESDRYSDVTSGSAVPTGSGRLWGNNAGDQIGLFTTGERYGNRSRVYRSFGTNENIFFDLSSGTIYGDLDEVGLCYYGTWRARFSWQVPSSGGSTTHGKFCRVWDAWGSVGSGSDPPTRISWTNAQVTPQIDGPPVTASNVRTTPRQGEWDRFEFFLRKNGADEILRAWHNGTLKHDLDETATSVGGGVISDQSVGIAPRLIGFDPDGGATGGWTTGETLSLADFWLDNKFERFEIWNSASRAASTVIEPQPALEWADTEAMLRLNWPWPSLSGCYLVFVDSGGNDTVLGSFN